MIEKCNASGCEREARMAVGTRRPSRPDLESTVYYDDRGAPKKATRYCKAHGRELVSELTLALVGDDEEEES